MRDYKFIQAIRDAAVAIALLWFAWGVWEIAGQLERYVDRVPRPGFTQ